MFSFKETLYGGNQLGSGSGFGHKFINADTRAAAMVSGASRIVRKIIFVDGAIRRIA